MRYSTVLYMLFLGRLNNGPQLYKYNSISLHIIGVLCCYCSWQIICELLLQLTHYL